MNDNELVAETRLQEAYSEAARGDRSSIDNFGGGRHFVYDTNDRPLIEYIKAIRLWHGYVRFIQLPKDNPDIEIHQLFVEQYLTTEQVEPTADEDKTTEKNYAVSYIAKHNPMVLLGDPGSGKSTLVNWIASELALNNHTKVKDALGTLLPVPIVLRELEIGQDIDWNGMLDALCRHHMLKQLPEARQIIETWLTEGKAMVLVDGLDEVGSISTRRAVCRAILQGKQKYSAETNRWLVTSRVVGFSDTPLDSPAFVDRLMDPSVDVADDKAFNTESELPRDAIGAKPFEKSYVAPLSDDQIHRYSARWFAIRDRSPERALEAANDLMKALRSQPDTLAIARNPNMLAMAALIYRVRARLPHGRAQLYKEIVEAYVQAIDEYRKLLPEHDVPGDVKRRWLARIGFEMQKNRQGTDGESGSILATAAEIKAFLRPEITSSGYANSETIAEEFLSFIKRRSGLLLPRGAALDGQDKYAFIHLSFQEYFAALHLARTIRRPGWLRAPESAEVGARASDLRDYVHEPMWKETILLLFEILSEEEGWGDELFTILFGDDTSADQLNEEWDPTSLAVTAERELLLSVCADSHTNLSLAIKQSAIRKLGACLIFGNGWKPELTDMILKRVGRLSISRVFDTGVLPYEECRQILIASSLAQATGLVITQSRDLALVSSLSKVEWLALAGSDINQLSDRKTHENIKALYVEVPNLETTADLIWYPRLTSLTLRSNRQVNLSGLSYIPQLSGLRLSVPSPSDLTPLNLCLQLRSLDLSPMILNQKLDLPGLMHLVVRDLASIELISGCTALEQLTVWDASNLVLSEFSQFNHLFRLTMVNTTCIDLNWTRNMKRLRSLTIWESDSLQDISALDELPELVRLRLPGTVTIPASLRSRPGLTVSGGKQGGEKPS
jgi:internalin A